MVVRRGQRGRHGWVTEHTHTVRGRADRMKYINEKNITSPINSISEEFGSTTTKGNSKKKRAIK